MWRWRRPGSIDAGVSRAGGPRRVRGAGVQCRACEECAGTQDRPLGCRMAGASARMRAAAGVVHSAIKAARDVIRYRRKLVEHRTSELQRLGNVLQDAGIKADSVASSVTTKSVRAMVEALIDGERRPTVLADLARGSMRSKIPDLTRAL